MFIEFACDCGHKFRTKRDNAGKSTRCPNCMAQIVVPAAKPMTRHSASRRSAPADDDDIEVAELAEDDDEIYEAELAEDDDIPTPRPKSRARRTSSRDVEYPVPVKKKSGGKVTGKSQAKNEENASRSLLPVIIGGAVLAVVLVVGVGVFAVTSLVKMASNAQSNRAAAASRAIPLDLVPFQTDAFFFKCQVPKDWEVESGGGSGNIPPWIRAEKDGIKISFRASQSGTLIGDITGAGQNPQDEIPDDQKPVHKVHEWHGEKLSRELVDYREIGPIEKLPTGMGEARLSKFEASGDWGGKIYALRVTLMANQWQWNLICQCSSEKEFSQYEPLFREVALNAGT